jgi:ariadne-1
MQPMKLLFASSTDISIIPNFERCQFNSSCYCSIDIFLRAFYSVTRNYFENLVRALETGLNDVGPSTSQSTSIKNTTSKNLGGKSKSGKNKAASSKSGSSSRGVDDSNIWTCDQCTYVNPKSAKACQACDHQHR